MRCHVLLCEVFVGIYEELNRNAAMASTQSLANRKHWESAARNGPLAPDAAIEWNDIHWTPLTAEPRGVDYIELCADGVSAMSLRPKGAVEDRVIFYSHGGGFVSGSIYTQNGRTSGQGVGMPGATLRVSVCTREQISGPA